MSTEHRLTAVLGGVPGRGGGGVCQMLLSL